MSANILREIVSSVLNVKSTNVRLSGQMDITRWEQWVKDETLQKEEYDAFMADKYHEGRKRVRK